MSGPAEAVDQADAGPAAANDGTPQAANDNAAQDSRDLAGQAESVGDASIESAGDLRGSAGHEAGEGGPAEAVDQADAGPVAANDDSPQAANDNAEQDSRDLAGQAESVSDASIESAGDLPGTAAHEAGEGDPAEPATEQEADPEQEPAQAEQPQSADEVPPDENQAADHAQDDDAAALDDDATAMQQAGAQLGDDIPAPETTSAPVLTGSGAVPAGGEGTDFMDADNYTATGHEVTYTKTATALGSDERTMSNLQNVAPMEGVHDVIAHGTEDGFMSLRNNTVGPSGNPEHDGQKVNAGQIVDTVRANPNYVRGTPLRMMVCHSGVSGAAQQVADEMGVPVSAPKGLVGTNRALGPGQEPLVQNNAGWIWVYPKGNK